MTGAVSWPAKVAPAETVKQARQQPQTGKFQTAVAPRCPDEGCVADVSISRNVWLCPAKPRRPCLPMEPAPRRYLCACCRIAVIICSHCDRGQRYCGAPCALQVRTRCAKAASVRYQSSTPGRHAHAARQRRYRARHANKVTHQGSPPVAPPALLPADAMALQFTVDAPQQTVQCHFCHCPCDALVRIGFLRRRIRRPARISNPGVHNHARDR